MKRSPLRRVSNKRAAKMKATKATKEAREARRIVGVISPPGDNNWYPLRADGNPQKPRTAKVKRGEMRSHTYRDIVSRGDFWCRLCSVSAAAIASEPHHWPATGHAPVNDHGSFPVCRECHHGCHNGRFGTGRQHEEVARFWVFLAETAPDKLRIILRELAGDA